MDLMYMIIQWLKTFIEHIASITSFIGSAFLPDEDPDEDDSGFGGPHRPVRPGRK